MFFACAPLCLLVAAVLDREFTTVAAADPNLTHCPATREPPSVAGEIASRRVAALEHQAAHAARTEAMAARALRVAADLRDGLASPISLPGDVGELSVGPPRADGDIERADNRRVNREGRDGDRADGAEELHCRAWELEA